MFCGAFVMVLCVYVVLLRDFRVFLGCLCGFDASWVCCFGFLSDWFWGVLLSCALIRGVAFVILGVDFRCLGWVLRGVLYWVG